MTSHHGTHSDLHSEQGALPGEHPGRAKNPVIKVLDLAWLEFGKPDLAASERFAHAFGFATVSRTADEIQLRGTDAGAPCVIVRRGPRSKYLGAAFRAADSADVVRLRRRHRGEGREAAGEHRRAHGGPDRPERGTGAGRRRHPRARRPPVPADAGVQLRPRDPARERHPAPASRAGEGPATGPRRAPDHEVRRDPELVPGAPRSHRQRLQVLRGAARTRPHDELHPL